MSTNFLGEIRIFAGNFAPAGWAFCNGQVLQISQNDKLFDLISTTYGGDGQMTFALPNLGGSVPVHSPANVGQTGGTETVTLTIQQIPAHNHALLASSGNANSSTPSNDLPAVPTFNTYNSDTPASALAASSVGMEGGGEPHPNLMPYCALNYIIALFGAYPQAS